MLPTKCSYYLMHGCGEKGFIPFSRICLKVNVTAQQEVEFAYFEVGVQHFSYYTMEIPHFKILKFG